MCSFAVVEVIYIRRHFQNGVGTQADIVYKK